jgi:rare lipoprotein A
VLSRSTISIIALALMAVLALSTPRRACAGVATWTWHSDRFDLGGACEDYPQASCTCAHRVYPLGTYLRVDYHGRTLVCRVADRGPDLGTWWVDLALSRKGALLLGILSEDRAHVSIKPVGRME